MIHDWYKDFFHGMVVELWCAAVPAEQTAVEVNGLLQLLELPESAHIIDMPCGSARHSIGLAKAGHRVMGVDISAQFLDVARRSAEQAGVSIELIQADMNDVTLEREFDAAICLGNSFGYADQARTAGFARRVADALKPGGRFILDCGALAESILPSLKPELRYEFGDIEMHICNQYCPRNSRLETHYTFTRGDEVQRSAQWHWVYTTGQICRMLEEAGLQIVGLYRSLDREPFRLGDQYVYLMSQKPTAD